MKTAKYFTASWCGPCKAFKPIIEELIEEGQPIEILDIDENDELAKEYAIRSVPTTIIFDDEGLLLERFVGAKTKEFIQWKLIV
jgi:thioredoxin 1